MRLFVESIHIALGRRTNIMPKTIRETAAQPAATKKRNARVELVK